MTSELSTMYLSRLNSVKQPIKALQIIQMEK